MPSWTHLMVGLSIFGLSIFGLSQVGASPKNPVSGGGSGLKVRTAEVEGRRYFIVKRDATTFEVFSPDDPEAWLIFDVNTGPIRQGSRGSDVDRDMRQFPKDLMT
jgi:hypothetical protein